MAEITPETTIVLITGGNQGLGFETVKKLTADHPDYHIILSGRRPDAVNEAVATFQKDGRSVAPLIMDITSESSIKAAVKAVTDKYGHIDVLINNSAISAMSAPPIDEMAAQMKSVFDTNVIGTALVTDYFLPLLAKSTKTKRIVFVSSGLGSLAGKIDPSQGLAYRKASFRTYSVSKSALNMLALHYAVDYEDDKTWKINIADPGHYCATTLNNFAGPEEPALGAISTCLLAELGSDGETGEFKSDVGTVAW